MKILKYNIFESKTDAQRQTECEIEMQRLYELCVERGIEIFRHDVMLADAYDIIMMFYLPQKRKVDNESDNSLLNNTIEYMYAHKRPHETVWKYYMVVDGKNSNIITRENEVLDQMKLRQDILLRKKSI